VSGRSNEYAVYLGRLFEECPKTVLAAIAVSFASSGGDFLDQSEKIVAHEWQVLHENGIVPQAPPARVRPLIDARRYEVEHP
jgi:hypothetical protein